MRSRHIKTVAIEIKVQVVEWWEQVSDTTYMRTYAFHASRNESWHLHDTVEVKANEEGMQVGNVYTYLPETDSYVPYAPFLVA